MSNSWEQYEQLRELVLEGRASQSELEQFEQLVLSSPQMLRDYTEHAHQQATLVWRVSDLPQSVEVDAVSLSATQASDGRGRLIWYLMAMAAAVLLTLGGTWLLDEPPSSAGFAMITSTEDCRWGDSSLATAVNHPLGQGRIRMLAGIATLRFPAVDVTLEGDVDIEIVSQKSCILHSGRVFANVEPGGEGFTIRTPTAVLVDRGTRFGVHVLPTGTSDLKVFSGKVDVDHAASNSQVSVTTDENIRVSATGLGPVTEILEPTFQESPANDAVLTRPVHLSTATGLGDDAYVSWESHPPENCLPTAMLVKLPALSEKGGFGYPWRRKAFMRFDMTLLGDAEIAKATLHLHGVQTNIGFASLMPDATFAVYGLTDEVQDDWSSESINWMNSPGNLGEQLEVDPEATTLIGRFTVPQSDPTGRFEVGGQKLIEFLRRDTNGIATLIIIPETSGLGDGGAYVHGFANRRHPELPAPTLRLGVK